MNAEAEYDTSLLKPGDPLSACCQARIRRHEGEWSIWFTCSDCKRPVAEDPLDLIEEEDHRS